MGNKRVLGIFALAVAVLSPYAASANVIILNGTYSRSTVAKDCAAIGGGGGIPTNGSVPGGYGCINSNNGNTVNCYKGKCQGITRTTGPSHPTLGGILGGTRKNAPAGGTVSSKAGSKPVNETSVRGGTERGGRKR